jgi:HlyD family secretion protein
MRPSVFQWARRSGLWSWAWAAIAVLLTGCHPSSDHRVQGYVEGEFVYVACPSAGALQCLAVQRGMPVTNGTPLFSLDNAPEKALRDEAAQHLAQARANWEDAQKGKRSTEIDALQAQLNQAQDAAAFSEKEFARQERLSRTPGAGSLQDLDRARTNRDRDRQHVAELEAELKTARLGARNDQIAAAEAEVRAREAALAKADWDLAQTRQTAPEQGMVFDTLFREGEWVGAGRPVVVLLPPRNIKVRAFVAEKQLGALHLGEPVRVRVDGAGEPYFGKLSFISPQAEFTPPVLYSEEGRSKLVYMIEAVFDPQTAARLHPGQPVEVHLGP